VGIERSDLLVCMEESVSDADLRKDKEAKLVEVAIWAAIDGLVQFS
jgi:hypothetical protein